MTDIRDNPPQLDTQWLRNTANFGRGSSLTEALHLAATEIDELRAKLKALEEQKPVAYGCHIDLEEGQAPDGCVLDEGRPDDCVYARKYGIGARNHCGEWKPIQVHAAGAKP